MNNSGFETFSMTMKDKGEKKVAEFVSMWVTAHLFSLAQIRGNSLGELHLAICR